jgi:hypothetical protein
MIRWSFLADMNASNFEYPAKNVYSAATSNVHTPEKVLDSYMVYNQSATLGF